MRKASLQIRFLSLFILSTVAILVTLGGISVYLMVAHLKDVQLANLRELSRFAAAEVGHEVNDKKQALRQIADAREVADFSQTYRVPPLATHLAEHSDIFAEMAFISADGVEEVCLRDGQMTTDTRALAGDRDLGLARAEPGRVVVSTNKQGQLVFTLGIKRYFGDVFVGYLRAAVPLADVARHLSTIQVGKSGYIAINQAESGLLHLTHRPSGTIVTSTLKVATQSEAPGEPLRLLVDGEKAYAVREATEVGSIGVLAVLPYEEFIAGPHMLARLMTGISLLILAIGSALAYVLGGRVSRPLSQLVQMLQRMPAGQHSVIPVTGAPGEIVDLVEAYNTMVQALDRTMVSRNYLDNIFDSMHESLLVIGLDGTIERVNRVTCDLLGYLPSEIEGQPVDLVVVSENSDSQHWLDQVTRSAGHFRERTYRHRDGELLPMDFSWTRLQNADGNTCGIVCLAQRQKSGLTTSKWRLRSKAKPQG